MATVATIGDLPDTNRSADLVRRALAGEESAFAEMVETYSPAMTQVSFVVCGDDHMADEAVAAAWPIVWRRLGTLREHDRLKTWLVAIAANEARQHMRARRRRAVREVAMESTERAIARSGWDRAAHLDLENALSRLSPDDRQLLALRYVAGFNSTELSRATGMSASGLRARLGRLLGRLRSELGDE